MAAPKTVVSGKTAALGERLRDDGSETAIDFVSSETPGYTNGVFKVNRGTDAEWIPFTGVTANGGTSYTATGCTRGLDKDATSLTDATSTNKKNHPVGTIMKYVHHSAQINKLVQNDADNTLSGNNLLTGSLTGNSTTKAVFIVQSVTTAERDLLTGVVNGLIIYNTTTGEFQVYQGGAWSTLASGSTQPNATTAVAGKVEIPTTAEFDAGTDTGGSATLVVLPSMIAKTGTAGETLVADDWVYRKTSDGKLYKADNTTIEKATIIGVVKTGGIADATVTYLGNGDKWVTTGLTAGSVYYVSGTPGALTATIPAHSSASVVPVRVGTAGSTTVMDIQIQRIPRRLNDAGNIASVANAGVTTITVGFPISHAAIRYTSLQNSGGNVWHMVGFGRFDNIASTQSGVATTNVSDVQLLVTNDTKMIAYSYWDGNEETIRGTASVNGSNNLLLTYAVSQGSTTLYYELEVHEKI